jgi:hypothetical protein
MEINRQRQWALYRRLQQELGGECEKQSAAPCQQSVQQQFTEALLKREAKSASDNSDNSGLFAVPEKPCKKVDQLSANHTFGQAGVSQPPSELGD